MQNAICTRRRTPAAPHPPYPHGEGMPLSHMPWEGHVLPWETWAGCPRWAAGRDRIWVTQHPARAPTFAFQGVQSGYITSLQHTHALHLSLTSPPFTTVFLFHTCYNKLQNPQRLLSPMHRKSCVANVSDSLLFDFILPIKVHSILEGEAQWWGIQLYPLEISQLTPEEDQISIMQ